MSLFKMSCCLFSIVISLFTGMGIDSDPNLLRIQAIIQNPSDENLVLRYLANPVVTTPRSVPPNDPLRSSERRSTFVLSRGAGNMTKIRINGVVHVPFIQWERTVAINLIGTPKYVVADGKCIIQTELNLAYDGMEMGIGTNALTLITYGPPNSLSD